MSQEDKVYYADLDPSHIKGSILDYTQTKLIQPEANWVSIE